LTLLTPETVSSPALTAIPESSKAVLATPAATPIDPVITGQEQTPSSPPQSDPGGNPKDTNPGNDNPSQTSDDGPAANRAAAISPEPLAKSLFPPTPDAGPVKTKTTASLPDPSPAAQSHDDSGMLARTFQVQAAAATIETSTNSTVPARTAADALRNTESAQPAGAPQATAPRTAATQEIAVHIARGDAPGVDVRVTDRAGQIHVAVRTPDTDLQNSLRQDLGTLVSSLQRSGYRAEAFTTSLSDSSFQSGGGNQSAPGSSQSDDAGSDSSGRGQQQPQQRQQHPHQHSEQHAEQRPRDRRAAKWTQVMEKVA
jgi:hypothetical protein